MRGSRAVQTEADIPADRRRGAAKRAKVLAEKGEDLNVEMPSSIRYAGKRTFSPAKRAAGKQLRQDWLDAKAQGRDKQLMLEQPSLQKELAASEAREGESTEVARRS